MDQVAAHRVELVTLDHRVRLLRAVDLEREDRVVAALGVKNVMHGLRVDRERDGCLARAVHHRGYAPRAAQPPVGILAGGLPALALDDHLSHGSNSLYDLYE